MVLESADAEAVQVRGRRAPPRGEPSHWQEKARRAEALGYSTLLTPDHVVDILPPLVPLVSAADATTTLRVGTFVLNNDFRHPVLVARDAAAIDFPTAGSSSASAPATWRLSSTSSGCASTRAATASSASARIVKALLAGDEVTFSGSHYRITRHRIHPLPVQTPRPPLMLGGTAAAS
jgi:alkanesulfonate monooxygenase SsuD/methylene tetrahydromethanopterin reductase-like flavin-dependent oxidoreductase (luciferase family)